MKQEHIKNSNLSVCVPADFNINEDFLVGSPLLVSQAVRVHLQNARQGTVAVKSRSDLVSRSNKKPWKQKGTGKARAGTPRSPLWRGGGVCFGPQPRVRVLSLPKKMQVGAMRYLFLDLLDDQKICRLSFDPIAKNTKAAFMLLKDLGLNEKKLTVLYNVCDVNVYYSFSNLKNVSLLSYDAVYAYAFARDGYVIFLEKDREQFEGMVTRWLM